MGELPPPPWSFFSAVFILENRLIFAEKGPTINSNLEIEMSREREPLALPSVMPIAFTVFTQTSFEFGPALVQMVLTKVDGTRHEQSRLVREK